jgi:hypothetical protein
MSDNVSSTILQVGATTKEKTKMTSKEKARANEATMGEDRRRTDAIS